MGDVALLGVVTGLQMEADIARALPNAEVLCLGPGPIKALQAAESMVEQGAKALMSFGIAGGLDPALQTGDLVAAPPDLATKLGAKADTIATVTDPALTPAEKSALFSVSGASAVDMETSAVQDVASAHSLPFMIVRAVYDTAQDTIPEVALKGVNEAGEMRPLRVALGTLVRPQDIGHLITLGKRQKPALDALKHAVKVMAQADVVL